MIVLDNLRLIQHAKIGETRIKKKYLKNLVRELAIAKEELATYRHT